MIHLFLAVIVLLLLLPAHVTADGGALQFTKIAGPFSVTLFSAPVPLHVGACDLSVMVQRTREETPLLDGQVEIIVTKPSVAPIHALASRENATNKLLYAANVSFPASGQWLVQVEVKHGAEEGVASGELTVLGIQPRVFAYWPHFTLVPLFLILFALNQWLKGKRRLLRESNRPPTVT